MSNIYEVSVNTYRRKLREAIEELSTVDQCFIYAGEFNSPDEHNVVAELQLNQSQVYIDFTFGQFIENPVVKGWDLNCNFRFYVAAKNDVYNPVTQLRNESEIILESIHQIVSLMCKSKFGLDVIGKAELQAMELIDAGVRNSQRYSIYAFNVTQRMNFYKENKK